MLYFYVFVLLRKESYHYEIYISCGLPQNESGGYDAYFPDLECCEASGDTLDDAIDNANEAARNWIMVEFEEENPVFPYISDINDIETEAGDIVRNISVNIRFYEGWDE